MIDINLDFSGLETIARDLQTLSKAENNKVLRDSTRTGAEVLRQEVIDRAPEKSGKLKKNIVVVTQKSRRRGESKRAARTVLTGMCYSVGSATRQGSSSLTRFIGQSAITSSTWRR